MALSRTYFFLSIITFVIGLFPKIETIWRIVLLVVSSVLLIIVYFSIYVNAIDKIEDRLVKLGEKVETNEKLLYTLRDILLLRGIKKK